MTVVNINLINNAAVFSSVYFKYFIKNSQSRRRINTQAQFVKIFRLHC